MPLIGLGEIAATITSLSWAWSNRIHTAIALRIGGVNVTAVRAPLYVAATGVVALLLGGPFSMPSGALVYLVISGLFGLAICDSLLYVGSVLVGSRIALLMQSLSACITAILGYLFLGESINLMCGLGIVTATCGVAFVLMEGGLQIENRTVPRRQLVRGVTITFISALFLSASFLLLKQALLFGVHPAWAVFVRMSTGLSMLWIALLFTGTLLPVLKRAWTDWSIVSMLLFGATVATAGNCLAAVAMKYTTAGIAATLIGLQPVMIILINTVLDRKLPTLRTVIGTCIAFSGAAMIFLR